MKDRNLLIAGPRIELHPIRDIDNDDMFIVLSDQEIKKTYMLPDFSNEEELNNFFIRLKNISNDISRFVYGIYLNDHIIGFLNEVSKDDNFIELGYFISSKHWNHGYATEALALAIDELFKMGYPNVEAAHFEHNLASGRVMQKCGMNKINKIEEIEYRNKTYTCIYYSIANPRL